VRTLSALAFVTVSLMALGVPLGVAGAAQTVPYSDPQAVGIIGLCNQAGQQITSGSINTAPFAWRAVSTQPAQGLYGGPTRTAVLMAYQPIMGLGASDWSGDQLTSSSRYTNPAAPMAAATSADESLAGFMVEYKPLWDGFFELRMYLGAAGVQQYSVHYPVLNIQVTGQTWQAVGGGPVNCGAGSSESIESILLTTTTTTVPSATPAAGASAGTGTSGTSGASGTSPSGSDAGSAGKPHRSGGTSSTVIDAAPASASSHRSSGLSPWFIVAGALVLGAAALFFLRRRRLTPSPSPVQSSSTRPEPPTTVGASSTKGTTP
jgi:LPXTG-motif cell wall-anchored protein